MKKHILGFAVFSLIVGSVVFISAMFYKPVKKEYVYEVSNRSYCKLVKNSLPTDAPKLKIVQAVYDTKTKMLNVEVLAAGEFDPTQDIDASISVITKKNNKTSGFVQLVKLSSSYDENNNKMLKTSFIIRDLKDISPLENMYVSISLDDIYKEKFDVSTELVPVLSKDKN